LYVAAEHSKSIAFSEASKQVHFVFGGGYNTLQHVINALLNGVCTPEFN
jgi:hypothetical protein